jgi:hypothetical protein
MTYSGADANGATVNGNLTVEFLDYGAPVEILAPAPNETTTIEALFGPGVDPRRPHPIACLEP